jgi:hypothetical protein
MYGMAEQLEIERRLVGDATTWTLLKEMWLIRGNRKRALISIGLMVCQQMTGVNAIVRACHLYSFRIQCAAREDTETEIGTIQNYYAPQMFQALGMNSTESSLFATGIYGVVKVVACLGFLIFAADSLGRRMSLLWTSIALSISMFIIGVYMCVSPPVQGQPVSQHFHFVSYRGRYLELKVQTDPAVWLRSACVHLLIRSVRHFL